MYMGDYVWCILYLLTLNNVCVQLSAQCIWNLIVRLSVIRWVRKRRKKNRCRFCRIDFNKLQPRAHRYTHTHKIYMRTEVHLLKCRLVKLLKFVIVIMLIVFSFQFFLPYPHSYSLSLSCALFVLPTQNADEKSKRWQQISNSHISAGTFTRFTFHRNRCALLQILKFRSKFASFIYFGKSILNSINYGLKFDFGNMGLLRNENTPQMDAV